MTIKVQAAQGVPLAQIARSLGIDRKTARRLRDAAAEPTSPATRCRPSALAKHEQYVRDRLAAGVPAAQIARDLAREGTPIAYPTLRDFARKLRPAKAPAAEEIRDLHTLRFLANGQNIIFLGPPGCGKTHLSTSLGHAAITAGEMVHFTTARELFAKLRHSTSASAQFRRLTANRAKLLIIDEIGYEPLDHLAATHFFRLVCERYERGSIILTSNKRFSEWGELIGDETLAAAILDRLLHHATTFSINGPSYRLKEKRRAGTYRDSSSKENHIT